MEKAKLENLKEIMYGLIPETEEACKMNIYSDDDIRNLVEEEITSWLYEELGMKQNESKEIYVSFCTDYYDKEKQSWKVEDGEAICRLILDSLSKDLKGMTIAKEMIEILGTGEDYLVVKSCEVEKFFYPNQKIMNYYKPYIEKFKDSFYFKANMALAMQEDWIPLNGWDVDSLSTPNQLFEQVDNLGKPGNKLEKTYQFVIDWIKKVDECGTYRGNDYDFEKIVNETKEIYFNLALNLLNKYLPREYKVCDYGEGDYLSISEVVKANVLRDCSRIILYAGDDFYNLDKLYNVTILGRTDENSGNRPKIKSPNGRPFEIQKTTIIQADIIGSFFVDATVLKLISCNCQNPFGDSFIWGMDDPFVFINNCQFVENEIGIEMGGQLFLLESTFRNNEVAVKLDEPYVLKEDDCEMIDNKTDYVTED